MALKSRGYVFKISIFKKLSIVLSVYNRMYMYVYVHISVLSAV